MLTAVSAARAGRSRCYESKTHPEFGSTCGSPHFALVYGSLPCKVMLRGSARRQLIGWGCWQGQQLVLSESFDLTLNEFMKQLWDDCKFDQTGLEPPSSKQRYLEQSGVGAAREHEQGFCKARLKEKLRCRACHTARCIMLLLHPVAVASCCCCTMSLLHPVAVASCRCCILLLLHHVAVASCRCCRGSLAQIFAGLAVLHSHNLTHHGLASHGVYEVSLLVPLRCDSCGDVRCGSCLTGPQAR